MFAASEPSEPHWNGRRLKRRRLKLESGELRCECILTHELLAWGAHQSGSNFLRSGKGLKVKNETYCVGEMRYIRSQYADFPRG